MTDQKKLCLNMIVKNEMANLARCLGSVVDHIDCWVIGDTGSTDGTQNFIKSFFAARNLPGELHSFPFRNFAQARNAALDCAYASPLAYDYLLLDDADMELVVEDRDFRTKLTAPSYRLLQRSGITYWNTRLVHRSASARYHGVTHEYIEVPGGEPLHGVWYKDHASGSNRADKHERDIRLLLEALKEEPENHRYWFYLAQSYRDGGLTAKAAEAYAKRAAMGGWDEEAWYARLQEARCLRKLGDEGGFLRQALAAFNQRPQRAEPLYDLARFYRERGMNEASVLFSEAGLALPRPEQDVLFLEDFVYTAGLKEEYSIAANYARDPARKDRGFAACNWLTLNRAVPDGSSELAWWNLFFYLQPASAMMPSFTARPIAFTPPDGYRPMNPSVTRWGEELVVNVRTVNYTVLADGLTYQMMPEGAPIHTRNFLLRLSGELEIQSAAEILAPTDLPEPSCREVLGFEDLRLVAWRGELWGLACMRELTAEAWCEQVLARIDESGPGLCRLAAWRVLHPQGPRLHEKNWMPRIAGERLQFIYLCDPTRVLDEDARTVAETAPAIAAKRFRGGSQAIAFDGGWLALIHEVQWRDSEKRRYYLHRFVWFDEANTLRGVSRPFFFLKKRLEFAAGLAWHPDGKRLLISYSVADSEAWLATVDAGEVRGLLEDVEHLPSGALGTGSGIGQGNAARPRATGLGVETSSESRERNKRAEDGEYHNRAAGSLGERPQLCTESESAIEAASLASIFRRWGTDKVTNGYADFYECLFRKDRLQIESVLEIGIGTMIPGVQSSMVGFAPEGYRPGGSLRSWRGFFPNATIFGIDVQPDTQFDDEERIVTLLCDSTDPDQVNKLMSKLNYREFDIIVDDGSHILENQFKTLRNFYPFLKNGGLYVVEDVAHNGLAKQTERIREICGDNAFFAAGPEQNPFVLTKRPAGQPISKLLSGRDRSAWVTAETNSALRNDRAVAEARLATVMAHLPLHPDAPKAWDNFLALFHTAATTEPNVPVLDAGACRESAYLPGLRKLGYTNLTGINLSEREAETVEGICYRFGDITNTNYPADHFGFVACLSVIEHGVDCRLFFKEMARILRPGGHLFVSMDYWQDHIDVGDRQAFGVPVKIFAPGEVTDLVEYASNLGLALVGDMNLTCEQRVINWLGLDYTFCNLFFRRSQGATAADRYEPQDGGGDTSSAAGSIEDTFLKLAPFLRAADSPQDRLNLSREFDARIAPFLSCSNTTALPQIHCFYEALSDNARHDSLIAATTSMRAMGHPVRVWSYSPQKLDFLRPHGIELSVADDVMPRGLFERIVAGSEVRYFSDIFRYAALYEHGGLWMDSDVVLLRPFPFRGDHFFNLQWQTGIKPEHFICGNVMYAKPYSRHLRKLYELAVDRFFESQGWVFGAVGPKLLSDYIASDAGAELRDWVFSPMFFNSIDWTEIDKFDRSIGELAEYLNDERVFGIHLWNARTNQAARGEGVSLISLLSNPLASFPNFTGLADRFNTDKNRHTGNRHFYARIYDRLLADRRLSLRRLMEIGLCRGLAERNQTGTPSVELWQAYFPFCHVIGVDVTDFSSFNNERFTSFVCDQSKRDELCVVAAKLGPGALDVIIDDGSHASFDQQLTLCEFFPLLADGGWYFIEDLDWQPPGEDAAKITLTKNLLREIQRHGTAQSADPLGVSALSSQFAEILFFDSHYEFNRAKLLGGLVAIRKRGGTGFVR
jgi:glycosyltransferase involved in cell wall biosynthesis